MSYIVFAAPLWADGSTGDGDDVRVPDMKAATSFLGDYAAWIGTTRDNGNRCVGLEVTIQKEES